MVRAQRVRDGGSRIEMQIVKWAAEGAVKGLKRKGVARGCVRRGTESRVFCDVGHTSVAGNMKVFR